jgi:anti-sigma B factor antagonist
MGMEVKHEERGAVTVVSIAGSLDAMTAPQLSDLLTQRISAGRSNLVADLAALDYTSSAGLRALLNAAKEARQRGGDMRLAAVQPNVHKVFELSGFTSILRFFPDVPAAVASYPA